MDLQKLMQQAQQMQKQLGKIEEELAETIYEGTSGGSEGVLVKVNGKNEVQGIIIPEELMDKENREMLQDMLLIAANDALAKATAEREEKMGALTQGMKLPGM
ncbi:MAG: YbaB/EbfC family nucleoid-associated protein [Solobacterium sp.]|nr:YbaB/EbfC family nucleoid-associated protein [Solobacterium sp.]